MQCFRPSSINHPTAEPRKQHSTTQYGTRGAVYITDTDTDNVVYTTGSRWIEAAQDRSSCNFFGKFIFSCGLFLADDYGFTTVRSRIKANKVVSSLCKFRSRNSGTNKKILLQHYCVGQNLILQHYVINVPIKWLQVQCGCLLRHGPIYPTQLRMTPFGVFFVVLLYVKLLLFFNVSCQGANKCVFFLSFFRS